LGWEERLAELEQGERVDLREFLDGVAAAFIDRALEICDGKKVAAADILGFKSYQTMDNWRGRSER